MRLLCVECCVYWLEEDLKRLQTQSTEREADFASAREALLRVTSEKDQLGFQLKTALSLAERRFTDIESLQGKLLLWRLLWRDLRIGHR